MLAQLDERLADQQLTLTLTERAKAHIVEEGYDPVYGARPLRRYLQRHIETMLGKAIIAGNLHEGQAVVIDYVENELRFV
jgi:ATP-dependent Clp protease ATP-binding subunit ClpB